LKLLGPEPVSFLKTLLEYSEYPLSARMISDFPDMPCRQIHDSLRQSLPKSATSIWKGEAKRIFLSFHARFSLVEHEIRQEFFSSSFPSDWMNFDTFCQVIRNKLRPMENARVSSYFRAFDATKTGYLNYDTYLLGMIE
jgi:Ca2+-binding EF-hand superfamily protein